MLSGLIGSAVWFVLPLLAVLWATERVGLRQIMWDSTSGFVVVVTLILASTLALFTRWRRSETDRPRIMLLFGLAAVAIGLAHIIFGSLPGPKQALWINREAFPAALTGLGSSLVAFYGIAWSLREQQRRDRDRDSLEDLRRGAEALTASLSNMERAVSHCDQLAGRGWQLLMDNLVPLAEPFFARQSDGGPTLWYAMLNESRSPDSSEVEIPASSVEVWRALQRIRAWDEGLVDEILALVRQRKRLLERAAAVWLAEYERLRTQLAGLSDELPVDLMPFVDDLEFIRDLITYRGEGDGASTETAAHVLAFVLVVDGIRRGRGDADSSGGADAAAPAASSAEEVGERPEAGLHRLWRPGGYGFIRDPVEILGDRSIDLDPGRRGIADAIIEGTGAALQLRRTGHWTDSVRPEFGRGAPDPMSRVAALRRDFQSDAPGMLFQVIMVLIAPFRRRELVAKGRGRIGALGSHLVELSNEQSTGRRFTPPISPPDEPRKHWETVIIDDLDEPRRTRWGESLRPRLTEFAVDMTDLSEGDPSELQRRFGNRKVWGDLSDARSTALGDDGGREPFGWTAAP
jgi:hypothetical protein